MVLELPLVALKTIVRRMLMKYLKVHIGFSLLDILLHLLLQGWIESSLIAYTNRWIWKNWKRHFFFFFGLGTVTIVLSVSTILLIRVSYLLKFLFNYVWEVLWYFIIVEIIGSSLIILYAGNGCNNNAWCVFDKMSQKSALHTVS